MIVTYSPAQLRRYLRSYATLRVTADGVRGLAYDGDRVLRSAAFVDPWHAAHILSDLDRALLWLSQLNQDPMTAAMLCDHYQKHQLTADIADAWGISQRTVHYRMSDGIRRMSRFLGWVEDEAEARAS